MSVSSFTGFLIAATLLLNACGSRTASNPNNEIGTNSNGEIAGEITGDPIANKEVRSPASSFPNALTDSSEINPNANNFGVANDSSPQLFTNTQFAPRRNGLTEPTSKEQRQAELGIRVNHRPKLNRDPFLNIPGSTAIPTIQLPPPLESPVALPPPQTAYRSPQAYTPAKPQPRAAETINVSGVVEIGGARYAIVSVPKETSSRYVRVGQWIAGNQVLVKRIEMTNPARVILQQHGREYAHTIGSGI